MTVEPWVRDDVSYTIGDEEFTIPAGSIVVGKPVLESEPSTKDEPRTYHATLSAETEHGLFQWQAEIEQHYGPARVVGVVDLKQPAVVTESESIHVRSGDEEDEDV